MFIQRIMAFILCLGSLSAFPMDALRQRAAAYEQAVEQRGLDGLKKPAALKMVYHSSIVAEPAQEGCWHNVSTACGEAGCACIGHMAGCCLEILEAMQTQKESNQKND